MKLPPCCSQADWQIIRLWVIAGLIPSKRRFVPPLVFTKCRLRNSDTLLRNERLNFFIGRVVPIR